MTSQSRELAPPIMLVEQSEPTYTDASTLQYFPAVAPYCNALQILNILHWNFTNQLAARNRLLTKNTLVILNMFSP